MPRHKSLVVGARIVHAGKRRKCYHDAKHLIAKGDRCLEVRDGLGWKGYCPGCAASMFAIGHQTLTELRDEIGQQAG